MIKTKTVMGLTVVIFLILMILQQWLIRKSLEEQDFEVSNQELMQSINSLNDKIDSLKISRDSLQAIVDTSKVQIINIEKRYETIHDRIITQSVDSDCILFARYISNNQGLLSNNNSTAIKDN